MLFSISEVAKAAGVASYRIKYALETGALEEPRRLAGRRCFQADDVEKVRRHFAAESRSSGSREAGNGKEAS